MSNGQRWLRLIIDPVDGSKAFDNAMSPADCPVPQPTSAVSIAAVCPVSHQLIASAVYCFDLGDVFSSVCLNPGSDAPPVYMAFRNEAALSPITEVLATMPTISAKMRVLNGNYNSKALLELAKLELALMERNQKTNLRLSGRK